MHILVLQHAAVEHPGSFRRLLKEDGHSWDTVKLDKGKSLPLLEKYDALWVLGGPMDVWEEDAHPWLIEEKKFIKEAVVVKGIPFLGLCLGHQLLSEALGGHCGKSQISEVGVMDVYLTQEGITSPFFDNIPATFKCLQWHGAEIKEMPPNAVCLASSPLCNIQAMSWFNLAFSLQFHLEVEPDTVENWAGIKEYQDVLVDVFGPKGVSKLKQQCFHEMSNFEGMAKRVYLNWLKTTAKNKE